MIVGRFLEGFGMLKHLKCFQGEYSNLDFLATVIFGELLNSALRSYDCDHVLKTCCSSGTFKNSLAFSPLFHSILSSTFEIVSGFYTRVFYLLCEKIWNIKNHEICYFIKTES